MIPVNRITRWPFPGNPVLNTLVETEELRVPGEEMLNVYGALTLAIGSRDGKKIFNYIKRLATEAAEKTGGIPCIYFKNPKGEFVGVHEDREGGADDRNRTESDDASDADTTGG
jgi:hypothetical protein